MKKVIFLFLIQILFAQNEDLITFNLKNPIVVSASRFPVSFLHSARSVAVLDSAQLAQLPVTSVQEALEYIFGVDLLQRGSPGVQADINLRGAGYEQVLIMIDGVNLNDPQTGHHNLNLTLPLNAVDRIEVMKGAGSRLYGPGAMGGVINIITRKAKKKNLALTFKGGDYRFFETMAALDLKFNNHSHSFYLNQSSSAGFLHNTDFKNYIFGYKNELTFAAHKAGLMAGFKDIDFGANRFYHPSFPDQREKTQTTFFKANVELNFKNLQLTPKVFWRHHNDDFILDATRPEWYHNKHRTDVWGSEIVTNFASLWGQTSLLASWRLKQIKSNNLGNHQRAEIGFSAEYQFTWHQWQFTIGSSFFNYQGWGWQVNPGLDVAFQLRSNCVLFASTGKGFRPPSFTELYYSSPANKGNLHLKPEESIDFEIGSRWQWQQVGWALALFQRHAKNLIDWKFDETGNYWQVQNIGRLNTRGIELNTQWIFANFFINKMEFAYTYLTTQRLKTDYVSKYALNHLKHQTGLRLSQNLGIPHFFLQWFLKYQQHLDKKELILADVHLQCQFKKVLVFTDISNLFNRHYEDFISVPLPGRWFKMGVKFNL